ASEESGDRSPKFHWYVQQGCTGPGTTAWRIKVVGGEVPVAEIASVAGAAQACAIIRGVTRHVTIIKNCRQPLSMEEALSPTRTQPNTNAVVRVATVRSECRSLYITLLPPRTSVATPSR